MTRRSSCSDCRARVAPLPLRRCAGARPAFRFVDVTAAAGIDFQPQQRRLRRQVSARNLGSGCAFLDYDSDGWQDILLVNGMDWPGHKRRRIDAASLSQQSQRHVHRRHRAAGLDVEMYGMGVAVGDYNNDGFPDIFITCVGQNRLFRNTGKGTFVDVTRASGLGGTRRHSARRRCGSTIDRDGLLDLFVCNYVKWSPEHDVFCSAGWQAEVLLHAGSVSRLDVLAVPQPRRRHV